MCISSFFSCKKKKMPSKGLNLLIVAAGLGVNLYGLYGVKFGLPMVGYGGHFQVSKRSNAVCYCSLLSMLLVLDHRWTLGCYIILCC